MIEINGEVINIVGPVKIPDSRYSLSMITVRCQAPARKGMEFAYYNFKCYKAVEANKLYIGASISCRLRRGSKLWEKDGKVQKKTEKYWDGEKMAPLGECPIIFEDYTLISKINGDFGIQGAESYGESEGEGLPF